MPAEPCSCVKVSTLIKRASRLLNDDIEDKDSVRWGTATLVDFMNEALTHLQSLRPDAFTVTEPLELPAGKTQKLPQGYASLVSIDCTLVLNSDGSFSEGSPVNEQDQRFAKLFSPNKCGPNAKDANCAVTPRVPASIHSWSKLGNNDPRVFSVTPTVPAGRSVMVSATVVKEAPCYCADNIEMCIDLPTKFHAALVDWMMYRSYSIDIESSYAMTMATRYENSFYRFISNGYLQEARFESGYFNGNDPNKGQPDPNVSQRSIGVR